jgi:hypothetical protein
MKLKAIILISLLSNFLFAQTTPYLIDEEFNAGVPANWTNSGTPNTTTNWGRNANARSFTAGTNVLTLNTDLASSPGEIYFSVRSPAGSPFFNHGSGCSDIMTYTKSNGATSNESMIFFNPSSSIFTLSCNKFTPLPIELLDFYANKNGKGNDMIWKVAEGENILYYTVEKSKNAVDFTELATVCSNNSTGTKSHSIFYNEPYHDVTYYRLSTKETSDIIKKYKIISVDEADNKWEYIHYQIENNLVLEFKNSLPKNSVVSLCDISGKELITQSIKQSQTAINIDALSSGVYFVRLSTPYKTEHFKIIISK